MVGRAEPLIVNILVTALETRSPPGSPTEDRAECRAEGAPESPPSQPREEEGDGGRPNGVPTVARTAPEADEAAGEDDLEVFAANTLRIARVMVSDRREKKRELQNLRAELELSRDEVKNLRLQLVIQREAETERHRKEIEAFESQLNLYREIQFAAQEKQSRLLGQMQDRWQEERRGSDTLVAALERYSANRAEVDIRFGQLDGARDVGSEVYD